MDNRDKRMLLKDFQEEEEKKTSASGFSTLDAKEGEQCSLNSEKNEFNLELGANLTRMWGKIDFQTCWRTQNLYLPSILS